MTEEFQKLRNNLGLDLMDKIYQELTPERQMEYTQRVIKEECFFDLNAQANILIDLKNEQNG